jgi:DNA-binding CsgD family transcriptional regulator
MPAKPGKRATFTDREVEVIGWLAAGTSMADIAKRIGVSESTIRVHLATIRTKAGGCTDEQVSEADIGTSDPSPRVELEPTVRNMLARWLAATG